ncbi:MAG: histidine triad nucleotide-binding protein [Clostridia bacterium]|nr:histidine triad nucleotide-binding protein [Clostridia bacterium]
MNDCIFCKIRDGVIPSEKVYEDESMFIIRDIEPKAERHFLMIPKRHFKLLSEMTEKDSVTLGKCLKKIPKLNDLLGLSGGYRLVINQGDDAGQTVFHLHVHILTGQKMDFPHL